MKTKKTYILIVVIFLVTLIGSVISMILKNTVHLNTGNVTGNTAGNINNGGEFCESNGVVYFANPYDGGRLYSMTPEETNLKKISTAGVTSINADSRHLYYFMDSSKSGTGLGFVIGTRGIYRSKLNGDNTVCLKRGLAVNMQLCGNYLYYQNFDNKIGTELYKIKIDKTEDKKVRPFNINPASCSEGNIYFNGTEDDHFLYRLNTANDSISVIYEGSLWNPIYHNGYFYYMDVSSNYRLCRLSALDNTVEVLTEDRIDCFNVYGDMIYYQKSSETEPALKRMKTDGSENEVVAEGVYNRIQITSRFVYFQEFDTPTPIYKTALNGPVGVTTFSAAKLAVSE